MKDSTKITSSQWINSCDYEREHLKDSVYLQADLIRTQEDIMQEIMEEENKRLPAKITMIYQNIKKADELKDNALAFWRAD